MKRLALGGVSVWMLSLSTVASAQYAYNMPNPMASYSMALMNNAMLSAPLYQQMDVMNRKAAQQKGARGGAPASQPASLGFTPGHGGGATDAYVARLSRQNPGAGEALRKAVTGQDIPQLFAQIVAPFGLSNHDVADAMAAHLIMRTMVATGAPPPSPQGVRKVRDTIAQAMAHDPKMASAAYRGQVGGEAQLDFLLVNAAWRAIGAGQWPADAAAHYRQNIASGLAGEGIDLKTMQLTEEGFVPR